ncbi:Ribose import ATP-binding protein RbsA [Neomoorella glycerini]|uniref:Ribose import ATP-binding protein RbsA n=1 Tax=Neomoorella glycerini TaxID=55779 RepID=A0A6I5ZNA8_9FIRM|nr:ABC transporter ATP-binding protein [Moorella glycerini]QGP91095.1 Ribose import ATP-binding protein RbsA [Moorella glycerini]
MKPILSLRGIVKEFPGVLANDHIDLDVYPGEVHALLGENGAGKSTLMNILYGLYGADAGHIFLEGREVIIDSPRQAIRLGIGMVHQHFMLIPALTVAENIILGMAGGIHLNLREAARKIRVAGDQYGLKVNPEARVATLSVGQQQRVEILKALYRGARILILDEPTAVLTPQETQELFIILKRLTAEGVTVIFISHKLNEVMAISRRVSVLRRGRLVKTVFTEVTSPEELARLMVGREVNLHLDKQSSRPGMPVLEVEDLHVQKEQNLPAVRGISFTVRAGEIFGLAGVDGNGQSELIKAITGLLPVSKGRIKVCGQEATNLPPRKLLDLGLAHIPEDRQRQGLVLDMNLKENLILEYFYQPPFTRHHFLQAKPMQELANRLIKAYDIRTPNSEVPAVNLSGGNQQKVILARVLYRQPKLLIAVHPTRGLDVGATEYIHRNLIAERDKGCAVLLVSTELDEILNLSDRIGIIYEGVLMDIVDTTNADITNIGLLMAGRKQKAEEAV